ncbi:MAG: HAD family phosphatase [Anaerolineae bacterium]|jgi:epoxide hydrolase-like predicted phosphatase|nr:HAD family phosphatase [Anaerolineae bacterium]MBT3714091.1 HAD family phosphatase [Anaerolineae bacterium]MBT4309223.1 HAD family phosphatase [Anaerolineae bacterium]MBT4459311.1 HAD family phosphatase [Anaerolineae bacterium]MBT4841193.1 HAD family phosphatase [Anaerolineae bacterium]
MSIKVVIFDMGGVLVRTEDTAPRAALGLRFGKTYTELDQIFFGNKSSLRASRGEISARDHMQHVMRTLDLPETDESIDAFVDEFFIGDEVDREIIDYIESLCPRYKTVMLSNAWDNLRKILINKWKIADAFDEIFISAEMGFAKPDPKIYEMVLDKLDVAPEETVFIDDFIENIEAACKLGMHGIHFQAPDVAMAELKAMLKE